ncbi:unnamed protein product, partial [Polarella glacialis]
MLGKAVGARAACQASDPRPCAANDVRSPLAVLVGLAPGRPSEEQLAQALVTHLESWRAEPKLATAVLSALSKHQLPEISTKVLRVMSAARVELNVYHCNAVLSACERSSRWQQALVLLLGMSRQALEADIISCNVAARACSRSDAWEIAVRLLDFAQTAALGPTVVTFSSVAASPPSLSTWAPWLRATWALRGLQETMLQPDCQVLTAAVSACSSAGEWPRSLHMLSKMRRGSMAIPGPVLNCALAACATFGHWALALSMMMASEIAAVDVRTLNVFMSACEKDGQWEAALAILSLMIKSIVEPSRVTYNTVITANARASRWQAALHGLGAEMPQSGLHPDEISQNAAMSACGKCGSWFRALDLLWKMPGAGLLADAISYSTAISALGASGQQWQMALELLRLMPQARLLQDVVCQSAAATACEKARQWRVSAQLLLATSNSLEGNPTAEGLSRQAWCLSRLDGVEDESRLKATLLARSATPHLNRMRPQELAVLLRSFASMSVLDSTFVSEACRQVSVVLASWRLAAELPTRSLGDVAWALATLGAGDPQLFEAMQQELVKRCAAFRVKDDTPGTACVEFTSAALLLLWACSFAGQLMNSAAQCAQMLLHRIGRSLDQRASSAVIASCAVVLPLSGTPPDGDDGDLPSVVLELPDRLVLYKPPGWQVDDGQDDPRDKPERDRLSSFVHLLLPPQRWPIVDDVQHQRGFLHRLDVPSSGLVLVAKTHEAYYDLKLQLAMGSLVRDYVVLCHGWLSPGLSEVKARVHWWADGRQSLSSVAAAGRPARTLLKVLAHVLHDGQSLSLVAVRIDTGRRHQIRTHLAHIGHPTVCDGKYSSVATQLASEGFCGQNFLHRYHLATDVMAPAGQQRAQTGQRHHVITGIPIPLAAALRRTSPRDSASATEIERWLRTPGCFS